jgi:hypothetical protein
VSTRPSGRSSSPVGRQLCSGAELGANLHGLARDLFRLLHRRYHADRGKMTVSAPRSSSAVLNADTAQRITLNLLSTLS